MATIINNPDTGNNGNSGGLIVGIVIAIILIFAFFAFGLPAIRGSKQTSGTTVTVPDKINVDVNKTN